MQMISDHQHGEYIDSAVILYRYSRIPGPHHFLHQSFPMKTPEFVGIHFFARVSLLVHVHQPGFLGE